MPRRSTSLYDARDLGEAFTVVSSSLPSWGLPAVAVGCAVTYAAIFKTRLAISRWRHRDRGYTRLESCSRGPSLSATGGDCFGDDTQVTEADVDEFRHALGIVVPRDTDLLEGVQCMLIDDPIPTGWELYRCAFGGVRFRCTSTEELRFFHPAAASLETRVRTEVARRDKADMAEYGANIFAETSASYCGADDHASAQSTFAAVFDYFVKKENDCLTPQTSGGYAPRMSTGHSLRASQSLRVTAPSSRNNRASTHAVAGREL